MKHHETVGLRLFNTTFSNISVISWQSVSLVKETGMAAHASAVHADDL